MNAPMQIYWPPLTPLIKKIIIICSVAFLLQYLASSVLNFPFAAFFALTPSLFVEKLFLWQIVTYMFMHGGIFHLLVNMLMLWMFGGEIERIWGTRKFITFYLLSGIFAGLVSIVSYYNLNPPIVGASGALYALLIAYAFIYPDRQLLFFGIFPMKTKVFIFLICLITFWVAVAENRGNEATFAHLGGILFGLIYMKLGQWRYITKKYSEIKRESQKEKLKSRFKVISNDMGLGKEIDHFWEKHKKDDPDSWN